MTDSDKAWVWLGRVDPYLKTVRTLDPYKLDPTLGRDPSSYFQSGERYLADLFAAIRRQVDDHFRPRIAVDFGCSVGRVAIPLAARCGSLLGLDVSPDVLREASENAARLGVDNARWLTSDDQLSAIVEPVDFFHSYNVLQHLPVSRGLRIISRALSILAPGGVIAVHVPYLDRAPAVRKGINWAQSHIPGVHQLANVVRRRPLMYPLMLMNPYNLTEILSLFRERGCQAAHCLFVDQGRYPGAILIARVER